MSNQMTVLLLLSSLLITVASAASAEESADSVKGPNPPKLEGVVVISTADVAKITESSEEKQKPTAFAAVVDIRRVMAGHAELTDKLAALRREAREYPKILKAKKDEAARRSFSINANNWISPEYTPRFEWLDDWNGREVERTALLEQMKQEFKVREAELLLKAYQEITWKVEQFAEEHKIRMVVNADLRGNDPDPNDPESVLRFIDRGLVHHKNLDITSAVIKRVNQDYIRRKNSAAGQDRKESLDGSATSTNHQ